MGNQGQELAFVLGLEVSQDTTVRIASKLEGF